MNKPIEPGKPDPLPPEQAPGKPQPDVSPDSGGSGDPPPQPPKPPKP